MDVQCIYMYSRRRKTPKLSFSGCVFVLDGRSRTWGTFRSECMCHRGVFFYLTTP